MNSLTEALAQKRKEDQPPEASVVAATSSETVAFIEFMPTPHSRFGYGTGQLLHYQLQTRSPGKDPTELPQVLTLGFATADVILTGKRLESVTELLVEGRLKRVAAQADRFAELHPARAFVSKIEVKPIRGQETV